MGSVYSFSIKNLKNWFKDQRKCYKIVSLVYQKFIKPIQKSNFNFVINTSPPILQSQN